MSAATDSPTSLHDRAAKTSPRWESRADLVVLGSGVAGLTAALRARELGLRVLVVTKAAVEAGSTGLAQGGVAVVLDGEHPYPDGHADSVGDHVADTVAAGAGLCDPSAVREILGEGPAAVARLLASGANFDSAASGGLARTREGGHSAFRVIHAGGDATGAEVERTLVAGARGGEVPILERHIAVDPVRTSTGAVAGLRVLDADGVAGCVRAHAVVVATGGIGQLYKATSNPEIATGDGLALALHAGAQLADIEFVQFHPTVLYADAARGTRPLVTEALRGEGATLIDGAGTPVMRGAHPLGDLAPRDVVSAVITRRMAEAPGGVDDHVYLDATSIPALHDRFPTVYAACAAAGIDPLRQLIPVAPAAHFSCGGIVTDTAGRGGVTGLYAAGEVARTGLHGANRLASNSLLEGLVVGARAAESVAADLGAGMLASPRHGRLPAQRHAPVVARESLQRVMSRYGAIGRSADGLSVAGSVLGLSAADTVLDTPRAVEDASLTLIARAIIVAAAQRQESRGCHVRGDYPGADDRGWRRSQHIRLSPSGQPVIADRILEQAA